MGSVPSVNVLISFDNARSCSASGACPKSTLGAFLLHGTVGGWSRTLFLLAHELPQEVCSFSLTFVGVSLDSVKVIRVQNSHMFLE